MLRTVLLLMPLAAAGCHPMWTKESEVAVRTPSSFPDCAKRAAAALPELSVDADVPPEDHRLYWKAEKYVFVSVTQLESGVLRTELLGGGYSPSKEQLAYSELLLSKLMSNLAKECS